MSTKSQQHGHELKCNILLFHSTVLSYRPLSTHEVLATEKLDWPFFQIPFSLSGILKCEKCHELLYNQTTQPNYRAGTNKKNLIIYYRNFTKGE